LVAAAAVGWMQASRKPESQESAGTREFSSLKSTN
jgi:hypothetical protein